MHDYHRRHEADSFEIFHARLGPDLEREEREGSGHVTPKMSRAGWCKNIDKVQLSAVLRPFGPNLELLLRRSSFQKGRAICQT